MLVLWFQLLQYYSNQHIRKMATITLDQESKARPLWGLDSCYFLIANFMPEITDPQNKTFWYLFWNYFQYDKSYASTEEYLKRMWIFSQSSQLVDTHNAGDHSYKRECWYKSVNKIS